MPAPAIRQILVVSVAARSLVAAGKGTMALDGPVKLRPFDSPRRAFALDFAA